MSFFGYLRPDRSPFVFIFVASLITMNLIQSVDLPGLKGWLFHLPIYIVLSVSVFLSFYFRSPDAIDYEKKELQYSPENDELTQENVGSGDEDLERSNLFQIKFSRAFCISISILSLYFIIQEEIYANIHQFVMIYVMILIYISIFMTLFSKDRVSDRSTFRFSVFQIGILTGLSLLGAALSFKDVVSEDRRVYQNCTYGINFQDGEKNQIDPKLDELQISINYNQSDSAWRYNYILRDCRAIPELLNQIDEPDLNLQDDFVTEIQIEIDWKSLNVLVFIVFSSCYAMFWLRRLKWLQERSDNQLL